MPKLTLRSFRIPSALSLAGLTVAAVVLERRRARRSPAAAGPPGAPPSPPPPPPDRPRPERERRDEPGGAAPAPLPLALFAVSHFALLILLLAVIVGGLAVSGMRRYPSETRFHVNGGDPARGRQAIVSHGCGGCHVIPGVRGASGRVGPSLDGFADQMYIGGQLPNTPEHLIAWLQNPQRYAPGTAMPNLPVTEAEARDMAAYLYSD